MSKQKFIEAMSHVDDRILERYMKIEDRMNAPKKKWRGLIVAAACLVLVVSISATAICFLIQQATDLFDLKVWYNTTLWSGTETYGGANEPLYLNDLPTAEYLPIYSCDNATTELSISEMEAFFNPIYQRYCNAIPAEMPQQFEKIKALYSEPFGTFLQSYTYGSGMSVTAERQQNYYRIQIGSHLADYGLNGIHGHIDYTQTDEQIIASLSEYSRELFSVFGVSFTDVKLVRTYYSGSGVPALNHIEVYYYNQNDHLLNQYSHIVSDYVLLTFSTIFSEGTMISKPEITYYKNTKEVDSLYTVSGEMKRISLQQAEQHLRQGYIFNQHECNSYCPPSHENIDYTDYDYVGFTYCFSRENFQLVTGIPFYVFYKQLETTENGSVRYAKAFVLAVEVDGLTEHFEEQAKKHHS